MNNRASGLFVTFPAKDRQETTHRVVVSKKISKKAVERNLIRRRIKAILQTSLGKTPTPLVIICQPPVLGVSFVELQAALLHQIQKRRL